MATRRSIARLPNYGPKPRVRYSWRLNCWLDVDGYGYRWSDSLPGWIRSPWQFGPKRDY